MKSTALSNVVKQTFDNQQLTEGSLLDALMRSVETIRGGVIGAIGGGSLGVVASTIAIPVFWILGLTNPVTALGLGVFGLAKVGVAAGIVYGGYKGFMYEIDDDYDQVSESISNTNIVRKKYVEMSKKAISLVKERDELIKRTAEHAAKNVSNGVDSSVDQKFSTISNKIDRAYKDLSRYVVMNKEAFSQKEFKTITSVCNLGGKITYEDITKK